MTFEEREPWHALEFEWNQKIVGRRDALSEHIRSTRQLDRWRRRRPVACLTPPPVFSVLWYFRLLSHRERFWHKETFDALDVLKVRPNQVALAGVFRLTRRPSSRVGDLTSRGTRTTPDFAVFSREWGVRYFQVTSFGVDFRPPPVQ